MRSEKRDGLKNQADSTIALGACQPRHSRDATCELRNHCHGSRSWTPFTTSQERHRRSDGSIPIHLVYEDDLEQWRDAQDESTAQLERGSTPSKAERGKQLVVPGAQGRPVAVVVGLGRRNPREEFSCWIGRRPFRIACRTATTISLKRCPAGRNAVRIRLGVRPVQVRALSTRERRSGSCTFDHCPRLDAAEVERLRAATALARDLINTPANDMSPEALAQAAVEVARRYGARHRVIIGDDLLKERFSAIHAVGRAAAVAPRLVDVEWGDPSHPKVSARRQGRVFRFRRARHQARRIDAADEEGHGRRRGRTRARAARHGCEVAAASARDAADRRERDFRQRLSVPATCSARAKD